MHKLYHAPHHAVEGTWASWDCMVHGWGSAFLKNGVVGRSHLWVICVASHAEELVPRCSCGSVLIIRWVGTWIKGKKGQLREWLTRPGKNNSPTPGGDLASESPAAIPGGALSKRRDDLGKVTWLLSPKAFFAKIGRKFSPFLGIWVFRCYYPEVLNTLPNGTNAGELLFFVFCFFSF